MACKWRRRRTTGNSYVGRGLIYALALLWAGPGLAAKTDVVVLRNGDRITCEVKKLERGILTAKTDYMGTVYIEWEDVAEVISNQDLQLETMSGARYLGQLRAPDKAETVLVASEGSEVGLRLERVVDMAPIKRTFWEQLDGSLKAGYTFTKATDVQQFSLSAEARQRTSERSTSLSTSNMISRTKGDTNSRSSKADLTLDATKFMADRWERDFVVSLQRNDELGIALRGLAGMGLARNLVQTNFSKFTAGAGLAANLERAVSGGEDRENLEAIGHVRYERFRYSSPKIDLTADFVVFPSLTESGRFRSEVDIQFRQELITDFFWDLSLYYSHDSKPPDTASAKSDYGLVTSLGWSF